MSSPPVRLRTALSPLAHHRSLLDATVSIPGVELDVVEVPSYPDIFTRMGTDQEFDLCELSVVSYFAARQHGLPFSALPVAPRHQFHHGDFLVNTGAGIRHPRDLEGRRVATRSYTVTPGVLDRGILSDEYGVDLDSITWVVAEAEHVPVTGARYAPSVEPALGEDLFAKMVTGAIPAGIAGANLARRPRPETVVALFPDAVALDRAQYERTGIIPVFTIIALHDRVLDGRPWLPETLFEAFRSARTHGLQPDPTVSAVVDRSDPVPFGLEANRASFDELLRLAREQRILTDAMVVDELFVALD